MFNIHNTMNLTSDLQTLNINQDTSMCSFDITSMYTNIPTSTLVKIILEECFGTQISFIPVKHDRRIHIVTQYV
jgi:hypothetical protein